LASAKLCLSSNTEVKGDTVIRTTPVPIKKAKQVKPKPIKRKSNATGNPMGRPSKFTPEIERQVLMLIQEGWVDAKICKLVEISNVTFCAWKKNNPNFLKTIKLDKNKADRDIVVSLRDRALGYSHEEEKIFCNAQGEVTTVKTVKHYPPDPTSIIFWLCNRHPDKWKRNVENKPEGDGQNIDWNNIGFRAAGETDIATDSPSRAIAAEG